MSDLYPPLHPVPVAEDPALSTAVKAWLEATNSAGSPPLETLPPPDARKALDSLQSSVKVDLSGIDVSERTISSEGHHVKIHIVRPHGTQHEILPVFIFNHGGGFVLGNFPDHQRLVRDLVVASGVVAVFVDYSLSPEAKYPKAVHEVYAATKWVAEHGKEINVDGNRLAVVGNSAGGNLATVTTLIAKEKGGPAIKLQILLWPWVDVNNFDTLSFKLYGKDRYLTTPLIKWMAENYTTDPEAIKQIYHSPLLATVDQLKNLPPTLIQVAEADILRDGGEAYGRKLDQAGVAVTTIRYDGVIHDFGLLNPLAEIPQVKSLILHAAAELKKHLF